MRFISLDIVFRFSLHIIAVLYFSWKFHEKYSSWVRLSLITIYLILHPSAVMKPKDRRGTTENIRCCDAKSHRHCCTEQKEHISNTSLAVYRKFKRYFILYELEGVHSLYFIGYANSSLIYSHSPETQTIAAPIIIAPYLVQSRGLAHFNPEKMLAGNASNEWNGSAISPTLRGFLE